MVFANFRRCSAALACGIGGREYFAKYGMSDERIFYYPVEPDYQQIERVPDSAIAAAQARFGLDPTRRRMVFSGRLTAVKRPELLIEAFAMIATARPEWDLVMMGDGPLRGALEGAAAAIAPARGVDGIHRRAGNRQRGVSIVRCIGDSQRL